MPRTKLSTGAGGHAIATGVKSSLAHSVFLRLLAAVSITLTAGSCVSDDNPEREAREEQREREEAQREEEHERKEAWESEREADRSEQRAERRRRRAETEEQRYNDWYNRIMGRPSGS